MRYRHIWNFITTIDCSSRWDTKHQGLSFCSSKKKIEVIEIPVDMMDKSYDLPTYQQAQPLQQIYI